MILHFKIENLTYTHDEIRCTGYEPLHAVRVPLRFASERINEVTCAAAFRYALRRLSLSIRVKRIRAGSEQNPNGLHFPIGLLDGRANRVEQRSLSLQILYVNRGPMIQQDAHRLHEAGLGRAVESRLTLLVTEVHVRAESQQLLQLDGIASAVPSAKVHEPFA